MLADNVLRSNTILYCQQWRSTVTFYRDVLKLAVNHETDWLVEFKLQGQAYLSIADARRTSIPGADGRGLTLSLQVRDLDRAHALLGQSGIRVSAIRPVWGARAFYLYDPEGHRIELWS
ncbi:MAG: VOC family protein [Desulfosarcina sp.]|nr:VOC family protein [Desulfobacterales bacterium]